MARPSGSSKTKKRKAPTIRLSIADQRKLADALLEPPKLAPALRRAMQAHRRLIAKPT